MKKYFNKNIAIVFCATLSFILCMILLTNKKQLPIVECSTTYPEYTIRELSNEATHIVKAHVTSAQKTIMEKIEVSTDTNLNDSNNEEALSYPVTPVYLEVEESIKGKLDKEFIYYEDGGVGATYIQMPPGYKMEKGMQVILFLGDDGYGWGGQSIYPVVDNKVILNSNAIKELQGIEITDMPSKDVPSYYIKQIKNIPSTMSICEVNDFINLIKSYVDLNSIK